MTVTVPQDFHKFVFQIKAFAHATGFLFGKENILAIQLNQFVKRVEWRHISVYKNCIANKENFAAKILWSVDSFVQLFLKDCRKCADQEDVNQRVIDFKLLDMDIALFKFRIKLPPCFHKKTVEWRDNKLMAEKKEGGKGGKRKSNIKDDGKKNNGKKRAS